jgi:hypothetical protein
MPGTDPDYSATPRPNSPISPTGALKLLLGATNLSIHAAAALLTTAMRTNECRLWCNDNLVPPHYIATSLLVVARTEADDRPRADVVSRVREAWVQQFYNFEFDADEVRALPQLYLTSALQTTPEPTAQPETIEKTSPPATPEIEDEDGTKINTKTWITTETRRMKADGQIPADISITDLAKKLAQRMEKAARSNQRIYPVRWGHIKNELPGWGLWPINKIKT